MENSGLAGAAILALRRLIMATGQTGTGVGSRRRAAQIKYDPTWPGIAEQMDFEGIPDVRRQDDVIWGSTARAISTTRRRGRRQPRPRMCVPPPAVTGVRSRRRPAAPWGCRTRSGWPKSEPQIITDRAGNVYIGGAQAGDSLLNSPSTEKFISDFGHRGPRRGHRTEAGQSADRSPVARPSRRPPWTRTRTRLHRGRLISIGA